MLDPRTHAAKTRFCCHLAQGVALSVERMISSSHGLALRVNTRTPLQLDRCRRSKGRTRKPTPGSNSKGSGVHIHPRNWRSRHIAARSSPAVCPKSTSLERISDPELFFDELAVLKVAGVQIFQRACSADATMTGS
jgi:hypothetical protein